MVNQINKQTFYPTPVGAVSNRTGAECLINSKVYHSFPIIFVLCSTMHIASGRVRRKTVSL